MKNMLITGAAGFIGNYACRRYRDKYRVTGVDDMSNPNAKAPEGIRFQKYDAAQYVLGLEGIDIVLHLAAQVAVTKSIQNPIDDFQRNAYTTMQLAHWANLLKPQPVFIYASTNKVYGELPGLSAPILDSFLESPSTPYGISKAVGGMYVRELLPVTGYDFRQSCIWGEDQIGTPDQGWVGFIARSIREGKPITCYGDGNQIRDLLHVSDLLDAYDMAISAKIPSGKYTVGGGLENYVSFVGAVRRMGGEIAKFEPARPKDQQFFIAESDSLRYFGWRPKVSASEISKLTSI